MDKKYQIFISSTYEDLKEARDKVIKTILDLYCLPVGMEMFSAGDDEQWKVIKDTIGSSDYYIVIIGHRYGSETEEGISYTEKEYDYAKEQGIPIMAFVRERNVPVAANDRDDDPEKNRKLESFIEKATINKMCDYWNDSAELATKVAVAIPKSIRRNPRPGWIRAEQANFPQISGEIARLSKENKELRDELEALRSLTNKAKPCIEVMVNGRTDLELVYIPDEKLGQPPFSWVKPLNYNEVPSHLLPYTSEQSIRDYNDALPSDNDLEQFFQKWMSYSRKKNGQKLSVSIANTGSAKASEVYLDIVFPDTLLVMGRSQFEGLEVPPKPHVPTNPFHEAEREYRKDHPKPPPSLNASSFWGSLINPPLPPMLKADLPYIPMNNPNFGIWVKDNRVTIHVKRLMHTREFTTDDEELYIVPLTEGNHPIQFSIICEEYDQPETWEIAAHVSLKQG